MEMFSDWLQAEMDKNRMNQAALAKASGVTGAQISRVLSGSRGIGTDALKKIAHALGVSEETIFEKAGVFKPSKSTDPIIAEITHLASQLPPEDVQDLIDLARSKIQRHERTANAPRRP
jgi:transcriptional regulator with XRE-family HTH domain